MQHLFVGRLRVVLSALTKPLAVSIAALLNQTEMSALVQVQAHLVAGVGAGAGGAAAAGAGAGAGVGVGVGAGVVGVAGGVVMCCSIYLWTVGFQQRHSAASNHKRYVSRTHPTD